ncbi:MAG: hypothetical protein EOO07_15340 [Chitinophagaceae bacterium]|nr:MAG: hypothetical protein EOO07_15340 [Chitinophagaceae bacterium]
MTSQSITELAERFNKKKGIAASLLILTSDFRISGKTPTPQSPYYILLQGKPENIEAVKTKIKESPIVSGLVVDEANFGYTYPEPYYSILPFAELSSGLPQVCTGEKENYKVINNIESGDSIGFWLGLDLSKLPSYSQQADFLRNNISFNSELAKYDSILTKSDFLKTLDDETDKSIAANCTHFIHMRVEEMEGKTLFVKLQFRNNQPTWIQTYNHSDDSQADINRSQTFGLANIYTALRDAYGEKPDQPFFKELQITLVKK